MFLCYTGSGIGSACTSARGSIGEAVRAYCPHVDCCHAHEEQEPAELKKIKKVKYIFICIMLRDLTKARDPRSKIQDSRSKTHKQEFRIDIEPKD